jgi:AcrR family transcriptional regulator
MTITESERAIGDSNGEREDGRSRIVAHALRLFLENGYADVSMQQIAAAAGLRKASIYHHFKDKNALFNEIVLIEMRRTRAVLQEIADEERDLRSTLETVATAYLSSIRSDLIRLMADYRRHVPESEHEQVHAELFAFAGLFERIFARAATEGAAIAIPPRYAGAFYMQMMMALLFQMNGELGLAMEPAAGGRMVTSALLDGILRR